MPKPKGPPTRDSKGFVAGRGRALPAAASGKLPEPLQAPGSAAPGECITVCAMMCLLC